MGMYLIVAARNLIQARRRTLLLGGALSLVTALLVVLLGFSRGITENIIHSATTLSTGHVNVGGFYKITPDDLAPVVLDSDKVRRVVEENTPGLAYVTDRLRGMVKLVSDKGSAFTAPAGVDARQESHLAQTLVLAEERAYKEGGSAERKGDLGKLGAPGSIVLFVSHAKRLQVVIGDQLTLTSQTFKGVSNSASATVVAVVEDLGLLSMWTTFVPKQMLFDLYQLRSDTTGTVMIYLKDVERSNEVLALLRKAFEEKGFKLLDHSSEPFFAKFEPLMGEDWTGQKLDLTTWEDEVSFVKWVVTAVDGVSFFLIGILILIIAIGLMNAMWISVRERTGEVGTLRAIGMSRPRILGMFMTEALMLGVVANTAGALLGLGIATAVNAAKPGIGNESLRAILMSDTIYFAVRPAHLVASICAFTFVVAISSLWPSMRAARMQPVTAIQQVE